MNSTIWRSGQRGCIIKSLTGVYQHILLEPLKQYLDSDDGAKMAVIQTQGSHFQYIECYPRPGFSQFVPDDNNTWLDFKQNPDLVNSFDNTIYYLDYFINEVIKMLEGKNAILVYASDYAESLGEEGRALYAGPLDAMEQRRVPFFIWFSSRYRQQYPEVVRALQVNATRPVSHDHLFHTIPALGGIESTAAVSELNLSGMRQGQQDDGE